jgi:hypothetical protein
MHGQKKERHFNLVPLQIPQLSNMHQTLLIGSAFQTSTGIISAKLKYNLKRTNGGNNLKHHDWLVCRMQITLSFK